MTNEPARDVEAVDTVSWIAPSINAHEIPRYLSEIANSRLNRINRHSRASSLVSVSTKFTTNTLNEDARSIDLVLGGQYFRIARDGSRVTDSAPPPYSTLFNLGARSSISPSLRGLSPAASEFSIPTASTSSLETAFVLSDDEDAQLINNEGFVTPRQQSPARSPQTALHDTRHQVEATISVVDSDHSRPITALAIHDEVPDRHPSYKSGVEVIDVVPANRRQSRADTLARSTPLRQRNGRRLPSLDTFMRQYLEFQPPLDTSRQRSHSAGAILELGVVHEDEPLSMAFRGRSSTRSIAPLWLGQQTLSAFPTSIDEHADDGEESSQPLPMDDENDISLHYAGMMRRLDREHRKVLQAKDHEIASLRQQLDEKDHVYRQQLRARDFTIDDLQEQLKNIQRQLEQNEQSVDSRIEKAIFRTEDLWEARWRDRNTVLLERMKRIEEDAQKTINALLDGKAAADTVDEVKLAQSR